MRLKPVYCAAFVLSVLSAFNLHAKTGNDVSLWLTTGDRSSLLVRQSAPLHFQTSSAQLPVIEVNDRKKYQSMDGFGFALTGGSAQLLMRMDAADRTSLLKQLFGTEEGGIGVSYLRISIGSSDMNDHAFTYDDPKPGETDPSITKFDLGPDSTSVLPVLKEILAIRPSLKILGSPWSAPAWMKTNDNLKGGSLKPEYYGAYAQYLVKYLNTMKAHGISIDAITIQNEPLNPKNTPSMVMQAEEQASFVKEALGPAFRKERIKTKIIIYDHNCDKPEYPLTVLSDPEARKYINGSAFHLYGGEISALSKVHDAFPKKNIYFTEQMVVDRKADSELHVASAVQRLIIGAPRNWSRNVLLWNLAADPENGPHTDSGGCTMCEGAITLDGNMVTRNLAYYTVAHASKFVVPGSVRIQSSLPEPLPNVAFKTPDGKRVVIVTNTGTASQTFQIQYHNKVVTTRLSGGAVGTYVW